MVRIARLLSIAMETIRISEKGIVFPALRRVDDNSPAFSHRAPAISTYSRPFPFLLGCKLDFFLFFPIIVYLNLSFELHEFFKLFFFNKLLHGNDDGLRLRFLASDLLHLGKECVGYV